MVEIICVISDIWRRLKSLAGLPAHRGLQCPVRHIWQDPHGPDLAPASSEHQAPRRQAAQHCHVRPQDYSARTKLYQS